MLCDGTAAKDEPKFGKLLESTYGILFLGTPHGGSDKEKMGQVLRRFANLACDTNKKILDVLSPKSEVLAIIEQRFQRYCRNSQGLHQIKIHNCHEKLPVKRGKLGNFALLDLGLVSLLYNNTT